MSLFSSQNYKQRIIAIFTFLGGLYFFLFFVLPESLLEEWQIKQNHENISLGFISIGLLTFGLGIINLFMIHGGRILYLKKGWEQSLALIGGLMIMLLFSVLNWRQDYIVQTETERLNMLLEFSKAIQADNASGRKDVPDAPKRTAILKEELLKELSGAPETIQVNPHNPGSEPGIVYQNLLNEYLLKKETLLSEVRKLSGPDSLPALGLPLNELLAGKRELVTKRVETSFSKKFYNFLFQGLFVSLGSALFSLLGVYIAAAAYRAFRIKTWESSLMMAAALIVMLGQISYGTLIYHDMPAIRGWLLEIPNSAVSRAITIGASVAGLVLAFRMWFSIESDSFSKKDK